MKVLLLIVMSVAAFSSPAFAQSWHGIEPIRSTCSDVERILGVAACDKKSVNSVFKDNAVTIVFAKDDCDERWPYEEYGVPSGTVTDIVVIPRYPKRLMITGLAVDISTFEAVPVPDQLGMIEYSSIQLGMKFTASRQGEVLDVKYFPASIYDHLRCISQTSNNSEHRRLNGPSAILIGEYDPKSSMVDEKLFADLVSKFNDFNGTRRRDKGLPQIYIISYAGRRSRVGEARRSASMAKQHLIDKYQINAAQIGEIDGGFVENAKVQLFIRPNEASPPIPQPTVHPKKVITIDENP